MNEKAIAYVYGSAEYPRLQGRVTFHQIQDGVLITAEVHGLPLEQNCANGIFGFHIHEGNVCTGNSQDPFTNTGGHYNPTNCPHPYHAGDLPPLFSNNGYAFMSVLINKFTVNEIIGRTVIIHSQPDDFTTQPSGNSGKKIACGEITEQ